MNPSGRVLIALSGAFIVVGGLIAAATAAGVLRTGGSPVVPCPSTPADQLVVRGSVEQIYVVHAGPGKQVTIDGTRRLPVRTTDALGGLVVRDVPVGRYSVSVEGDRSSPHDVTVVGPDEPPPSDLYSSQTIDIDHLGENPVDGYITTRDCNQLSYVVELPGERPADGRYNVVISYSGYSPGVRDVSGEYSFQRQMFRRVHRSGVRRHRREHAGHRLLDRSLRSDGAAHLAGRLRRGRDLARPTMGRPDCVRRQVVARPQPALRGVDPSAAPRRDRARCRRGRSLPRRAVPRRHEEHGLRYQLGRRP